MADIFEQVDDALRQDRMQTLWRRYGWMIIAAAVLIVAGTAAVVAWRAYERSAAEERTDALTATFDATAEAEPAEAVATLTAFADEAEPGIAAIARLQAAARALNADDRETAVALYQQVADSSDTDPALRELATILGASLTVGTTDLDVLRSRLAAMEASNSPWRHLANEIVAAAAIEAGDLELARARLMAISDDAEAPIGLRGRATELLAALGFELESEPDAEAEPSPANTPDEPAPAPEQAVDAPAPAPEEADEPSATPAAEPEAAPTDTGEPAATPADAPAEPAETEAPQPAENEAGDDAPADDAPADDGPTAEEPAPEGAGQ